MPRYLVQNSAFPTTAVSASVLTGTNIKTMIQVTAASTRKLIIPRFHISFKGTSPVAEPVMVELLTTGTVAGGSPTSQTPQPMGLDTTAALSTAGFQPSSEGTITTTRILFSTFVHPTSGLTYEWSLGREPAVAASDVVRMRVHAQATVGCICWFEFEE